MMTFVSRVAMVLVVGAGLAVAPSAAAQAAAPIWSSWDAAHSGLCMEIPGGSTANKTQLAQNYCNSATRQLFTLEPRGTEGAYLIRNYNSQKCLDVRDYSTGENAVVQQYTCHAETNQLWFQAPLPGLPGYYHFVNRRSWKCLTVQYGSVLPAAKLVQYTCNAGGVTTHQAWR